MRVGRLSAFGWTILLECFSVQADTGCQIQSLQHTPTTLQDWYWMSNSVVTTHTYHFARLILDVKFSGCNKHLPIYKIDVECQIQWLQHTPTDL